MRKGEVFSGYNIGANVKSHTPPPDHNQGSYARRRIHPQPQPFPPYTNEHNDYVTLHNRPTNQTGLQLFFGLVGAFTKHTTTTPATPTPLQTMLSSASIPPTIRHADWSWLPPRRPVDPGDPVTKLNAFESSRDRCMRRPDLQ
jgi:hypothetical protein